MFNLLHLNGKSLVEEAFIKSRDLLYEHFNEVVGIWEFATKLNTNKLNELQVFLDDYGNFKGLMVKILKKSIITHVTFIMHQIMF